MADKTKTAEEIAAEEVKKKADADAKKKADADAKAKADADAKAKADADAKAKADADAKAKVKTVRVVCEGVLGHRGLRKGDTTEDESYVALLETKRGRTLVEEVE